ncbi:MAG: MCE family protein [Planctomycetes bacterium]|nr:MCE family protein [Planctomycetota bacterium]
MNTTTNHWKLGLFVVAAFLLAMAALAWLGASRFERDSMQFYAYFDESVHGLAIGAPVTFRGMEIGQVDSIHAAPDKKHIEVQAKLFVDKMKEIGLDPDTSRQDGPPPGLAVQLNSSFLTQVAWIEADFITGGTEPLALPFAVPFLTMRTVKSTFKSVEAGVLGTLAELPTTLQTLQKLLESVDREVGGVQAEQLSSEARRLMAALREQLDRMAQLQLLSHLDAGVGDVRAAAKSLDELVREWRSPDGPVRTLATRLEELAGAVEHELAALQPGPTGAAVRHAADAVADAAGAAQGLGVAAGDELAALRRTLAAIERLVTMLERDPSALLYGASPAGTPKPNR